jgi:molecular chaperone DnaJ
MSALNPYETLGVPRNASDEDIKSAYRGLALQYHPDRNPGNAAAEEKFKEIGRAYEILSDPASRERFDRFGTTDEGRPGIGDFFSGGFGLDDALRAFMENFGFGDFGSGSGGSRVSRGSDIEVEVDLDLSEAALGAEREIRLRRDEACETCEGSGADPDEGLMACLQCGGQGRIRSARRTILGNFQTVSACAVCRGSGKLPKKPCGDCGGRGTATRERKISVSLPAGVDGGHFLRLRGQGNHPGGNGVSGDLIVSIRKVSYGDFRREGDNLVYSLTLSVPEAALGTDVEITGADGEELKIEIPAGTQPGDLIVVRGEGTGRLRGRGRGNLIVSVGVYVPRKLSRDEKKTLEDMLEAKHFRVDRK